MPCPDQGPWLPAAACSSGYAARGRSCGAAAPAKPSEEDLARGVVDPGDKAHMVNLTLKLPAVVRAFLDTRCKEGPLQLQFLRQLSVTCHFRWGAAAERRGARCSGPLQAACALAAGRYGLPSRVYTVNRAGHTQPACTYRDSGPACKSTIMNNTGDLWRHPSLIAYYPSANLLCWRAWRAAWAAARRRSRCGRRQCVSAGVGVCERGGVWRLGV
jgi:hypothetical protein